MRGSCQILDNLYIVPGVASVVILSCGPWEKLTSLQSSKAPPPLLWIKIAVSQYETEQSGNVMRKYVAKFGNVPAQSGDVSAQS